MSTAGYKLAIKGIMSELPEEQQQQVKDCFEELKAVMDKYGEPAYLSYGLLGCEIDEQNN